MIEKVVKKLDLKKDSSIKEDMIYWLRKTPEDDKTKQSQGCAAP